MSALAASGPHSFRVGVQTEPDQAVRLEERVEASFGTYNAVLIICPTKIRTFL